MPNKVDIPVGSVFGKWVVLSEELPINKVRRFLCKCECGTTKIVWFSSLRNGASRSCGKTGCYDSSNRAGHKMSGTYIYKVWENMRTRCTNPNNTHYNSYGGRGITYCDRWASFENFYRDMGNPEEGMTLERIDVNKGYSPDNCTWATRLEQANNRRNNRFIEWQGKTQTAAQWERELGFGRNSLNSRFNLGWPLERAMTEQPNHHRRPKAR